MADSGQTRLDRVTMKPYRVKLLDEGTLIADTGNLALWATTGTGVSEALSGESMSNHRAIIGTTTSGAITLKHTPASPVDLTGKTIVFRFKVGSAGAAFSAIRVYLTTSSGNYYQYTVSTSVLNGWYARSLELSQFTEVGSPDISSIDNVSIICSVSGTDLPAWILLDHFGTNYPGPCIIIPTSDDGADNIIDDYYPVLAANGMEMTTYIIRELIGDGGYLTTAELATLNTAGWDIAVHGNTNLTTLSAEDLATELDAAKAYNVGLGYTNGAEHYSYPFSVSNAAARAGARARFRTARSGSQGQNAIHQPAYADHTYNMTGYGVDALSTAAFQALVDTAIATKTLFIPYWHTLAAASFQTEIEYIKTKVDSSDCLVMTMSEYWMWLCNRYGGSRFWETKQA